MRHISTSGVFDQVEHEDTFRRTFALLNRVLEDDSFRRYEPQRDRFLGGFSISAFEAITSGLAKHLDAWEARPEELAARIMTMWSEPDFRNNSGSEISPRRRTPRLVHFGRTYFA